MSRMKTIVVTGNPVIDALGYVSKQEEPQEIRELLERLEIRKEGSRRLILLTAHRRENFGKPIEDICQAIQALASRGDVEIVYPVHLNPNVQEPVNRLLKNVPHVTLLPPLDYLPLVHLMKRATLILTDSGGIQEEAPAFGVPVLVLRETTERPEGIDAGTLEAGGNGSGSHHPGSVPVAGRSHLPTHRWPGRRIRTEMDMLPKGLSLPCSAQVVCKVQSLTLWV